MSKLEELIQQYCPDGVEYKKLGEICNLSRGKVYSKSYIEENAGEYPVYSSQTANNGELGRISTYDYDGEYLTWTTDGAYAGTIFYRKGKFSITNVCGLISIKGDNLHIKFLFYWLIIKAPDYVYRGMGNPKLMSNQMEPIRVPIPPLPVQDEIVRILDSFTELQAELQAELQKRLQQYIYYRDNLLTFEDRTDIEWKKLREVAIIGDGLHGTPHYSTNTGCFFINGNNLRNGVIVCDENTKQISEEEYEKIKVELDDTTLLMSINGTVGNIAFYKGEHIALGKSAAYFRVNPHFISKSYLYYYLQSSQAHSYYNLVLTGSTIKNLGLKSLREMAIPVPPLSVQKQIVDILDRFEKLTNDITAGLPAEIEARRKQYEYYRDQLLTFKQKA